MISSLNPKLQIGVLCLKIEPNCAILEFKNKVCLAHQQHPWNTDPNKSSLKLHTCPPHNAHYKNCYDYWFVTVTGYFSFSLGWLLKNAEGEKLKVYLVAMFVPRKFEGKCKRKKTESKNKKEKKSEEK